METRLVRLRELTRADIPTLFEWRSNPEFLATCTSRESISLEKFAEEIEGEFQGERVQQFLIEESSSSIFIGTIYAYEYRKEDAYISITIFLSNMARGHGYGPDAIALMLRYLFKDQNLYKVYMDIYEKNIKSLELLQRSGFQQEGRFKKQHLMGNERCDVLRFAVFAEDLITIDRYLESRS